MGMIMFAVLGLAIAFPTHATLFGYGGVLLVAAIIGFQLGMHWDRRVESPDSDEVKLLPLLKPRAMLIGICILLPLVPLGAGLAYYSGSYKVADLTSGLINMGAFAVMELVFAFIGLAIKRRQLLR